MLRPSLESLPCTLLKGVGPRLAEKLEKAGMTSIQSILFHFPFRYQKQRYVRSFEDLQEGDTVILEAKIQQVEIKFRPRRTLLCYLSDGKQSFLLRFFHFNEKQRQQFQTHEWIQIRGEVRRVGAHLECVHPSYQFIDAYSALPAEEASLFPVYSCEMGLSQALWYRLTSQAVSYLAEWGQLDELLPGAFVREQCLPSLTEAIVFLHRPPKTADLAQLSLGVHPAQKRLIVEELLVHQLMMRKRREYLKHHCAIALPLRGNLVDAFLRSLPYSLTQAQKRVFQTIQDDLMQTKPMMRLVQGDVGSGKTVVSALAALVAIENGKQVAVMAPTELLAEQHYDFFIRYFSPLGIPVLFLSGKLKGKRRVDVLHQVATQSASVVIGTHALFQEALVFSDLALAIIDEQHRFGVQQRLALQEKAKNFPHQLMMSATPIPRTLAMVAYADLDQSIIDELPPGRQAIQTHVISQAKRAEIISRVRAQCEQGRQAYWICTLIEESETLQCETAEKTYRLLQASMPNLRVGLVHGRLSSNEKQAVMKAFRALEFDVLVATTVIEVGVDVPNASLMIIENAERLGLSQLHQLRGRVGRGEVASHCVLLYQHLNGMARERLAVMRETQDGFLIAQRDLELRGVGDILGTRQSGEMRFRIANCLRDAALIPVVDRLAKTMLEESGDIQALMKRWREQAPRYLHV